MGLLDYIIALDDNNLYDTRSKSAVSFKLYSLILDKESKKQEYLENPSFTLMMEIKELIKKIQYEKQKEEQLFLFI